MPSAARAYLTLEQINKINKAAVKEARSIEIFEKIANVVVEGDKEGVVKVINEALEQSVNPMDIIQKGLTQGIYIVGDKFEKMEMYLPEMLMSAEAMKAGAEIVKPHIKAGRLV